jgi:hypothetical protein
MGARSSRLPRSGTGAPRSTAAYVTSFTPAEVAEIAEIEDRLRSLAPLDSEALAPTLSVLAGQLWRRDRLLADLDRHGVARGRADRGKVAPAALALTELERAIVRNLGESALLPRPRPISG